jgi:tRNA threonylcarbamoyladenosine biosynthesis protein TsaE
MASSLELLTDSADGTRAIGRVIGETLVPGDLVSLTGDLGAGKTTFVQGAAAGLEVTQPVLSPTFTLIREYEGRSRIYHMDVYRLETNQDVLDLGFDEMLDSRGIVFVEWGDVIESLLPDAHLQVDLRLLDDGAEPNEESSGRRGLSLTARGLLWEERWNHLAELTAPWSATE